MDENTNSLGKGNKDKTTNKEILKKKKLKKALNRYRVRTSQKLKPPEVALGIHSRDGSKFHILGTRGNFSLLIGKAKSRKSFCTTLFAATLVNPAKRLNRFENCLKTKNRRVLYFDTEQGKYHVQLLLNRICRLLEIKKHPNLRVYALRSMKPSKRLKFIEKAIYGLDNIGVVIIDGIKDLITSINSEEEATGISAKLLKWTEERNIHIMCVLHQNKGDANARGHLGSELTHKAETVLSVTKSEEDKDISIVEAEMCRNEEPEPFAFEVLDGLPIEVEDYEERTVTRRKRFNVLELPEHKLFGLLNAVFSKQEEYGYSMLIAALQNAYKTEFKAHLADNPTKKLITDMVIKGWLVQEKQRGPYKIGQYRPEEQ